MTWVVLVVAVVLVGLTVAAVLGRIDGSLGEPTSTLAYVPLPDGPLTPEDLEALRLDTGMRGYRMDQVDEVIGRLAEEIAHLREQSQAARTEATGQGFTRPGTPEAGGTAADAPAHES